jgi:hypothetical protein
VLVGFSDAGAVDRQPTLFSSWESWAAGVAYSHMKCPLLTHFRLPRSRNHWLVALLAFMEAAALDVALRPAADPGRAMHRWLTS